MKISISPSRWARLIDLQASRGYAVTLEVPCVGGKANPRFLTWYEMFVERLTSMSVAAKIFVFMANMG